MTPSEINRAGAMWCFGSGTYEIASELQLSESDVHNHLIVIRKKAKENGHEYLSALKEKAVAHWGVYEATKCETCYQKYKNIQNKISSFEKRLKRRKCAHG